MRTVWISRSERGLGGLADEARAAGARVEQVDPEKIEARASSSSPQGVVATADALPAVDLRDAAGRARADGGFLVASDGVEDPGNLGALMRTAESMGATGVVLPERGGAPLSPTTLKAAAGAVEHIDVVEVSSVAKAVSALRDLGLWVISLDAGGEPIHGNRLLAEPLVLVVGNEGRGVSRLVLERSDLIASIPTVGAVESLNASAAVAAACSEILRCRSGMS